MRICKSKYHCGDTPIDDSLFISGTTGAINRCILCARKTTLQYQSTARGKQSRSIHYHHSKEAYKRVQYESKMKTIAKDGGISYLYRTAKDRANRYGYEFSISTNDLNVPLVCPVLGIPLYFSKTRTDNTPSVDRIDNTKGYIKGNVQVISWKANHLKRDLTIGDLHLLLSYFQQHTKSEQINDIGV